MGAMAGDVDTKREATARRAGEADREIGLRLRAVRGAIGLTQVSLAEAAGLTFQQIQKYETGKSRLSASMLCRFAEILGVRPVVLLPPTGADAEERLWSMLADDPRLARLLRELLALPADRLDAVLEGIGADPDRAVRHD